MFSNFVINHTLSSQLQIGLLSRGRPILLITRTITDRNGLHSVLLPGLLPLQNSVQQSRVVTM